MKIRNFDEYYNNHPLAQRSKARYNRLSNDKKEKLEILDEMDIEEYQLRLIKRKRIKPQKGNLFVVSPKKDMYFWGVVMNSGIDVDGDNFSVVFILNERANGPEDVNIPTDLTNLLIYPSIVGNWYWNKGFFYNVGIDINIPDNIDYGFYSVMDRMYVDEYRNPIGREPELVGIYGLSTGSGIAYKINYELIASGVI